MTVVEQLAAGLALAEQLFSACGDARRRVLGHCGAVLPSCASYGEDLAVVWIDSNPNFGTPSRRHSALDFRNAGLGDGLAE
jgi:hypothetical protein